MAFFYQPNYHPGSYASSLYGTPYAYRRPSPPPKTYSSPSVDPYIQALAEEQAARSALQEAIQRDKEARRHRAEEEARVRALAEQEARARARATHQRPTTMYDYPFAYAQPDYGYAPEDDDSYTPFDYFGYGPRRSGQRAPQMKSTPRMARSQSRPRPQPAQDQRLRSQPVPQQTLPVTVESIKIPISSPGPSQSDPLMNEAAAKIQTTYRAYAARKATFAEIESVKRSFESLRSSFSFPTSLEFRDDHTSPDALATPEERPRLAYTSSNAPVLGYEDGLVKLLQKLDAIDSHGDAGIRTARRHIVKEIEEELSAIDARIRRVWEERVNAAKTTPKEQEAMGIDEAKELEDRVECRESPAQTMSVETDIADSAPDAEAGALRDAEPIEAMEVETALNLEDVSNKQDTQQPEAVVDGPTPETTPIDVEEILVDAPASTEPAAPDATVPDPPEAADLEFEPTTAAEPIIEEPISDSDVGSSIPSKHHVTVEDAPDDEGEEVVVEDLVDSSTVKVQSESRKSQDSDFVMV